MITVELSFSSMKLDNHIAIVMAAKDIRSTSTLIEDLEEETTKYQLLAGRLNIGTFRTGIDKDLPLVEASKTMSSR